MSADSHAGAVSIAPAAAVDLVLRPYCWPFAQARRAEIDAHFAAVRQAKPQIWNGRVLLLRNCAVEAGVLRGEAFETDYASFLTWLDGDGAADPQVRNGFACAAVEGSDGGVLVGRMGLQTANAGLIYFPCGTPDPGDLVAGRVDLAASAARELQEETGLDAAAFAAAPGWTVIEDGPRLAVIRRLRAPVPAADLLAAAQAHLGRQAQPELVEVMAVRDRSQIGPQMPRFVAAYLDRVLPR